MADQSQGKGSATAPKSSSDHPSQQQQHPLSCTHCRQRKIKCDKVHPCSPCQRSNIQCIFPERARHSKKKRSTPKATNDELIRRLGRMEELIEKMKVEGTSPLINTIEDPRRSNSPRSPQITRRTSEESRSQESVGTENAGDGATTFMGSGFFRSLTNEFDGLKQTMDEVTDEEDTPESAQSPLDTQSSHASMLFGSSPLPQQELRLLHPPPESMSLLCNIYATNCDPMFKVLHIPTLQKLVAGASADTQNIPSGNYVEALLFATYYAAVTSLTDEECHQYFRDGREHLLARHRLGTETALASANLLSTKELGTLQALVVFLGSARSNDDSQYVWTMTSVAVRLGHSFGLHRESSKVNLSPYQVELRRRLWWQIIHLDIRCCEDRGSDPIIHDNTFNTKWPLNINDSDMDPDSMEPIVERQTFTEMTKVYGSHFVWQTAVRVGFEAPAKDSEDQSTLLSFEQKALLINRLEKQVEERILRHCELTNPLAWVTSVVMRLVMARLRLALYHPPMYDDRSVSHNLISRDSVLKAAVQVLEYSHLLDTEPAAARWRWYFNTHVQWHAMAATLAELCVQDRGILVERAWKIVDATFDDWATRVADSKSGALWRPIKRLMSKAQAKREEARTNSPGWVSQQQQPLPQFGSFSAPQDFDTENVPYHPDSVIGLSQRYNFDQGLTSDILSSLNVNETEGTINWAEWDEFMRDFDMEDAGNPDSNFIQPDTNQMSAWW